MTAKSATIKRASTPKTTPEAITPEEQIAAPQALIGIIARPVETFRRLRGSTRGYWWLVFAIGVVTLAMSAFATTSVQARAFQTLSANRPAAATTTDAAESATGQPSAVGPSVTSAALPIAGGAALMLLDYGVRALVVYGMSLLLGGKATLKQAFRMSVWTTVPYALRHLVQSAAMFVAGQPSVSGLSAALTASESQSIPILNLCSA